MYLFFCSPHLLYGQGFTSVGRLMKRTGPRTEPCSTPIVTLPQGEVDLVRLVPVGRAVVAGQY